MHLSTEQAEYDQARNRAFYWCSGTGDAVNGSLLYGTFFQRGFTMTELITVMVIIGILAAVTIPRFFDRNTFDTRGFYDQTISTLRYAQKTAIAQRRLVCVTFPTTSRIQLRTANAFGAAACDTDLKNPTGSYPAGQTTYTLDAPTSDVTLSGAAAFNFNALGSTTTAVGAITIGSYIINIDQETGYVR